MTQYGTVFLHSGQDSSVSSSMYLQKGQGEVGSSSSVLSGFLLQENNK